MLLALMAAAWPKFEPDDAKVALWHELFGDVDFQVAQVALKRLMLTSEYPPTIADMRRQVAAVTTPADDQITPAEAWGMVVHAIREYGNYREAEALASFPPVVQRTVKCIGWKELCLSEEPDVIRAQFMRMVGQIAERRQQEALIPPALKEQIAALAQGLGMERQLKLVSGKGAKEA